MKFNHFKIAVIFLLGTLVVAYTNCGKPFSAPSELMFQTGALSKGSVEAFEKTVYPITRSYCISCHSSIQPMHASDSVTEAHKAVIDGFKVNFSNIPASRLVAKLRDDQHNCWSDCAQNSAEMQAAIEKWAEAVKPEEGEPMPVDTSVYTDETSTMEMEFADASNPLKSNSVKLNIEAAMLSAPMELLRPAGAESYLAVTSTANTTLTATDPAAGRAFFNFRVPANGSYRLWALAHGPADADNSFFVNILNSTTNASVSGGARQWDIPVSTRFDWRQVPNIAPNLVAGTNYTLELRQREDGARVAGFIITSDTTFNGMEVGDFFGITLVFDLSQKLKSDVKFMIDVIDYDQYSYKFSKPRIVSATSNVYVKGVKVFVNDSFSPQHSTYTIVDKLVTPMDQQLSTYAMIVLKDKGPSGDLIKFSFDQLTLESGSAAGGAAAGGATGGTSPQTSLMAFQETVYPISRSSAYSCVGCHMGTSPRHASDNTLTAHDAALSVVDFNNPQNSRIVNKMRTERHNCGANCDNIANLYQNAIIEWRTKRQ